MPWILAEHLFSAVWLRPDIWEAQKLTPSEALLIVLTTGLAGAGAGAGADAGGFGTVGRSPPPPLPPLGVPPDGRVPLEEEPPPDDEPPPEEEPPEDEPPDGAAWCFFALALPRATRIAVELLGAKIDPPEALSGTAV